MSDFSLNGNKLTWLDTNQGEYGYRIYRATSSFTESNLPPVYATVPPGTEEYLDTDVESGTTYYYRVSAFVSDKEVFAPNLAIVVVNYIPNNIGDAVFGGYYAGNVTLPSGTYAIIFAPKAAEHAGRGWKNSATSTTGTSSTTDGMANTNAMIAANSATTPVVTHPAAEHCVAYDGGGYNDWYLPSKDELNLYWLNRSELTALNMVANNYWSSTEPSANYAWCQYMGNGSQDQGLKTNSYLVRPVRRIKIS